MNFSHTRCEWLTRVADDPAVPPLAFKVAFVLSGYVNSGSGKAWPSRETLARRLGRTKRCIRDCIDRLREAGHLVVTVGHGRGRTSTYEMAEKGNSHSPFSALEKFNSGSSIHPEKGNSGSSFGPVKGEQPFPQNYMKVTKPTGLRPADASASAPIVTTPQPHPAAETASPADARTELFREGLRLVVEMTGKETAAARSLIGRWLKTAFDDHHSVMAAIRRAKDARPADPAGFISGTLTARHRPSQGHSNGAVDPAPNPGGLSKRPYRPGMRLT